MLELIGRAAAVLERTIREVVVAIAAPVTAVIEAPAAEAIGAAVAVPEAIVAAAINDRRLTPI